jgi:drug/metabolite transporter (DMT)-like permease
MAVDRRIRAALLVAAATVFWSAAELIGSLRSPEIPLFQVVWMRYGIHLVALLAVTLPREGLGVFRTRRPGLQVGRGLLMIVMPAGFIFGMEKTRLDDVLAVFWLSPLALLALARPLEKERPRLVGWAAALTATLGAIAIVRPTPHLANAAIYGVAMGGSFSLYVVLTRTLRDERTSTNLFYSALMVFVPLSAIMPRLWHAPTPRDFLLMIGVALSGLGFLWALDRACHLARVATLAPVFALQAVESNVIVPVLFGDDLGKRVLAGTALVLVAIFFALRLGDPAERDGR